MSELAFLSAAELAGRLHRRELSPVDVVADALGRIERIDKDLNSYVQVVGESAMAAARAAEAEIAASGPRGPLHGVPVALKDIFDTAGIETAAGSKILRGSVPARDATVVRRLREGGTILLGKLNMHEFAYGTTTNNLHFGACRNPWQRDHVPGGSSGGSGAALAAGLCHLSLGTDTGGSIRIPAAACAIVGLKPTFGRVSRDGVVPLSWSLDHVGPMTRTVEDAALMLNAIAGFDPADPWAASQAVEDFSRLLGRSISGLRIGVVESPVLDMVEAESATAFDRALTDIERLGATRVSVALPHLEWAQTALHAILAAEASAYHLPWLRERPEDYEPATRAALELGCMLPAVDFVNARRMQQLIRDDFQAAFERVDAIVMPSMPRTAPKIGEEVSREPRLAWNRLMTPINLAGLPAIAVPCGFAANGLPIGLQVIGRPWDEARICQVAHAYEQATEWHRRRPPLVV